MGIDRVFNEHYRTQRDTLQVAIDALNAAVAASRTLLDAVVNRIRNKAYTAAGLAEGTNAATIKIVNTVVYTSDGVFKSKGATDNIAIPAGTTVADGFYCKWLVSLQADGTPVVTQGEQAASAALALLPDTPAGETPIGYFQILTAAATYVPGTTDNGAGTVTDTYGDINDPDSGVGELAALGAHGIELIGQMDNI